MTIVDRVAAAAVGSRRARRRARSAPWCSRRDARGRGRVVFVAGEAGIGKTSLVRAFCDGFTARRRVLEGACDPLFAPRPWGRSPTSPRTSEAELAREHRSGRGAPTSLRRAPGRARTTPTIVVLEDLHWADEATLDVLRLLGRRVRLTDTLVIATYRDDALDRTHPLRMVLGEFATERSIDRIVLERLSPAGVETARRRRRGRSRRALSDDGG